MLSENEAAVLNIIISDPKTTNRAIAKELGLSSAGVGKIRDKLEKKDIIKDYSVNLDPNRIGLGTFGILHLRVTPEGQNYKGGMGVESFIASNTNMIQVYRVPGRRITHIVLCAFRDITEMDTFLHVVQAQLSEYVEVVESFVFSSKSIIKDSYRDLYIKIVGEGEDKRMPEPVLFGRIVGDE